VISVPSWELCPPFVVLFCVILCFYFFDFSSYSLNVIIIIHIFSQICATDRDRIRIRKKALIFLQNKGAPHSAQRTTARDCVTARLHALPICVWEVEKSAVYHVFSV